MTFTSRYGKALAAILAACATTMNWGFETPTHAAMTSAAAAQSKITSNPNTSELLPALGIVDFKSSVDGLYPPLGVRYVDFGAQLVSRFGMSFEQRVIETVANPATGLVIPENYSVVGWLMRGAIREDDNSSEFPGGDEPGGMFPRVYGHFFDPQNDRGLTYPVVGVLGARAVDWALSPGATVSMLPESFATRENHFKVADAREAMWRALTLTRLEVNGALSTDVWPNDWPNATKEELRKAYWATTFRALGDSIHLLQDMAQPQHTRNDMHSGRFCLYGTLCPAGHTSFLEKYFEARTTRTGVFTVQEGNSNTDPIYTTADQLEYAGYANPQFRTYREFFSTGTGSSNATGQGLANYSNRGFYSFNTNIGSDNAQSSYPSPPPDGGSLGTVTLLEPVGMTENPLTGSLTFRTGPVDDFASGPSEANVKLSSVGVWDQFLKQKNVLWSSHTLNYYNYDEQARLLVKRAVGYSAGFLDYFFRGTLEISLPADGVYGIVDHSTFDFTNSATGFRKIKVRVANTTPPIGTGSGSAQDMMGGRLVAVLKYRRNKNLYVADLSAECGSPGVGLENCRGDGEKILVSTGVTTADGTPVPSAVLPAGAGPQEFHFTFDEGLPLDVTDLYLQIVYRGLLGAENDAVVVATRDIPEPTYFTIINATDSLICVKGVWYALNSDGSVPDGTAKSDILQMGYVLPSPLTSPRVAMNFKPPFSVPAWDDPLALANALQPGKFIRVAILTDEGTPYVYDMEYFEPGEPGGFIVEKNTFTYSNGIPSQLAPAMMRNFRDTNHFQYGFAYRRYGANCTTSNWPTSSTAADGGSYPIPALVPINTLAF